jgi:acyl-coenzyme A thioesterase PaaI-like protein
MLKKAWLAKLVMNVWPPFLLTGIHMTYLSKDFRTATVEMRMRWWNKNIVGSHFGGSLFAMTDPFYMLLLMANLGDKYLVWDKFAHIDFIKPGYGTMTAEFNLTDEMIAEIKQHTASGNKYLPEYDVYVKDKQGDDVALVKRTLYIRKKVRKKRREKI